MDQEIPTIQSQWTEISHLTCELPAPALLEIHNALPIGDPCREKIVQLLRKIAEKNIKAHWIRALIVDVAGNLAFDSYLYDKAVSRGKQETYFKAAEGVYERLQNDLEMISAFQISEQTASNQLNDGTERNTLVPMPDRSVGVAALQNHVAALAQLVQKMKEGLPNLLLTGEAGDELEDK